MSHAKYSPSSAHRWLNCPGSLQFAHLQTELGNAAIEGTKQHELIAKVLESKIPNLEIGMEIETSVGKIEVTEQIYNACKMYIDFVDCKANEVGQPPTIENTVPLTLIPEYEIYGTPDCVILEPFGRLVIADYKSGTGNIVEAYQNPQLIMYALCYLGEISDPNTIELCIVQPNSYEDEKIKTWSTTPGELLEYVSKIKDAIENPDRFATGAWCQWCAGSTQCPKTTEIIDTILTDTPITDPDKIAEILSAEKAILERLKQFKHAAQNLLVSGHSIPGYKLVRSFGNRTWIDVDRVIRKFGKRKACEYKVLSPAKLEKTVNESGKKWIQKYTEKPDRGLVLVHNSDKRNAVRPAVDFD